MNKPKDGGYICLEGIKQGNRFMTTYHDDGHDYTQSIHVTSYKILGYADTHEAAMKILYPNEGDKEVALLNYMVKIRLQMDGIIPIGS